MPDPGQEGKPESPCAGAEAESKPGRGSGADALTRGVSGGYSLSLVGAGGLNVAAHQQMPEGHDTPFRIKDRVTLHEPRRRILGPSIRSRHHPMELLHVH